LKQMLDAKNLDRELLVAAVSRHVPALKQDAINYVIDCRRFVPRELPYEEGMHTGCHPAIFNRVVRHDDFSDHLLAIRSRLADDMEMSRTSVSILLCDDAGRHGSMSVAKALAECIVFDSRIALGTVHILADQHAESCCRVCARCEFWTRRWITRNVCVKHVRQLWNGPDE
jgi:hypothetical protein